MRSLVSIPSAGHQHDGVAIHDPAQPAPLRISQAARSRDVDCHYAETLKSPPEQMGCVEPNELRSALGQLPVEQCEALILVEASGSP